MLRQFGEECAASLSAVEIETYQGAANALAGLTIIEIAQASTITDQTGEEVMQGTGALIKVQPQEDGMGEQISAQRNRAEGDIHRSGEVFPSITTCVQT